MVQHRPRTQVTGRRQRRPQGLDGVDITKHFWSTTLSTEVPEGAPLANERIGGWVAKTSSWYPIDYIQLRDSDEECPVNLALDWIAQAAEAGALTAENVYDKAFHLSGQWAQFAEDVVEYDQWWYNERHHYAFDNLGVGAAETASYRELADAIQLFIEFNTPEARKERAARSKENGDRLAAMQRRYAEAPTGRTRKAATKPNAARKKVRVR